MGCNKSLSTDLHGILLPNLGSVKIYLCKRTEKLLNDEPVPDSSQEDRFWREGNIKSTKVHKDSLQWMIMIIHSH